VSLNFVNITQNFFSSEISDIYEIFRKFYKISQKYRFAKFRNHPTIGRVSGNRYYIKYFVSDMLNRVAEPHKVSQKYRFAKFRNHPTIGRVSGNIHLKDFFLLFVGTQPWVSTLYSLRILYFIDNVLYCSLLHRARVSTSIPLFKAPCITVPR
jgi:hypothetical protein